MEKSKDVSILCGLMLECIDLLMMCKIRWRELPPDANDRIKNWRKQAYNYLADDPEPNDPLPLREFICLAR